jgi:hypothetical protein
MRTFCTVLKMSCSSYDSRLDRDELVEEELAQRELEEEADELDLARRIAAGSEES